MFARPLAYPPHAGRTGHVQRFRRVLASVPDAYQRWQQRHDLAGLDDRLLADIGVSRREMERECAKSMLAAGR